ncbi:ATP-binding cassette domain-containing protein [Domibacillus epiphyticus]|uniref:ABC transporter ATP-binding protein n=1 Tax=Domibacillus epiphyticus TaxID=1714355 RepID=A0A1V2AAU9_9BACI|nr:ABC transporter ATP-binding protein [Domibacillus epiphyticus]OMP68119.1 ABC transporter ATP-binding protein [Domibacillus epiphyticus]
MNVQFDHVTKTFGAHMALNRLSFTMKGPKIVGMLGRNGAGKTTALNMIAGCIFPNDGSIDVNGYPPATKQSSVCLINESGNFNKEFTVKDTVKSASLFYPNWDQKRADELISLFQLKRSKKVKSLSKGMESALGIIVGLASYSPVTIFDEPYIGLDAAFRSRFYDLLIEEFEREPRLFILSTHLIDEAAKLFEEIFIIHDGSLILHKDAETLREESFSVTGAKKDVMELNGKSPLHRKEFAGRTTAYVFGPEWNRHEAELHLLETSAIPIQELMVHLTNSHTGGRK